MLLEDAPDELVLGAVGRFWKASADIRRIDRDQFRAFSERGWAKAAVNFRAEQVAGRTVLTTDASARHPRTRAAQVSALLARDPARQRGDPRCVAAGNSPARRASERGLRYPLAGAPASG